MSLMISLKYPRNLEDFLSTLKEFTREIAAEVFSDLEKNN